MPKWTQAQAVEMGKRAAAAKKAKAQARKQEQSQPVDLNEADAKPHIPEQAPIRKPGPDGASQKELENWLGAVLGLLTFSLGLWIADGDDELAGAVAFEQEELDYLVPALARLLARSGINKRYGQMLIQSNDMIAMAMALTQYGSRVWPLVRMKLERQKNIVNSQPLQAVHPSAGNGNAAGNGYEPASGAYSAYST